MPFVAVPPEAAREVYLSAVRRHNAAKTDDERWAAYCRATGAMDVITAIYGTTAAGMLVCEADLMVMPTVGEDVPMCGGMLLDPIVS